TSAQNFLKKFADKSGNKSGDYTATYTPESLLMTWEKNTIGENNGAVKYPGLDKDLKLTAKGTNEKITSASVSTLIANYNSNLKTAVDQAISIAGQNDPAVSNDDKVAAYKDALDKIKADLNTDGTGKSGLTEINGALKSDAERVIATLNGVNSAAKTLKESFDPNSTANASLISTVQPGSDYATKYGALVPITDALTTDNLSSKLGDYVSMVGKYVSLASAASTLAGEIKTQTEVLNTTAQNSILDLVGKVRDEDKNNVSGYDAAVTAVRTANSNASTAKDSTELSTLASAYNSLNSAINSLAAPMRAVLNNLVAAYDKTKQDAVKKVYNAANNQGLQDAFDTAFETAHNSAANEKTSAADALTAYTQLREAYDYLSLGSVGAARKKLQDLYGSTDTNSGDYNNSTDDAKSTFVSARNAAGDLLDGDTGETPKYTLGEYSEAYDTLSQAITRLTSAAKDRLQAQYNQRTTIKQSKRYLNSTNENKAAYDKAVDAAKAALDRQNTTAEDYTNAYKALVNAENNLRDETLSNLRASIEQYIRDNTGYANSKNIPNTTSQALLDQAEKAGTVDELNAIKDNATALINMVEFARNTLSHADETKATTNYSSDTAERRQAVDNAQAALQDYLKDDNSAAVTTTEVRAKALTLLQALNALAGDRAYQTALTQLADEMRQYSNTVYSSKYQNDSQERRSAYRTAYLKAKALYEDVTQNNKTATADEVNTLYQNLYTARMALAGLSDLDAAKQRLQTAILVNSVTNSNLNDKQKQAFQQALDKVKNDGDLRALENTVITIAREQNLLKDAIGDQSTVEDSSKYEHASQESKDAYNQALKESQDLLNNKSDVDTWSDVAAKRADLNAKQQALNGVSPYAAELQGLIDQSYDTTVDLKYTGADVTKRTNYLIAVAKGRFTLADPASKDTDYQASIDAIKSSAKVLDGDLPRKIVLFGAGGSALIVLLGYLISMLLKNQKSEQ
ncbi:MAG: hypothetical protein Q3962_08535, partial [Corynebacterium sp.]|nr:hypothetical protein [Corynebacterium sp.]